MATTQYNRAAYLARRDDPEFKRKRKEYSAQRYQKIKARQNAQSRAWALANLERTREIDKAARRRRLLLYIYRNIRKRAKRGGIEFSISYEDLVIPERCPIFDVPFNFDGKGSDYGPSVDRIDNTRGYVPGNVHVICKLANHMKWTASPEQLEAFCNGMLNFLRKAYG